MSSLSRQLRLTCNIDRRSIKVMLLFFFLLTTNCAPLFEIFWQKGAGTGCLHILFISKQCFLKTEGKSFNKMKSRLKSLLLLLEVRSEGFLTSVALTISSSKFFTWAKNNSFTFEGQFSFTLLILDHK